jgi:hypothetical protein
MTAVGFSIASRATDVGYFLGAVIASPVWLSRMIAAQDAIRALYGRPLCTEFEKIALGNSAENFEKTGEIHEELIINMWDALGLPVRREDYGQMISMLCASGLIYLADKDAAGGRRWIVPMRVPLPKADLLKEQWLSATAEAYENEGKAKTLRERLKAFLPPEAAAGACSPADAAEAGGAQPAQGRGGELGGGAGAHAGPPADGSRPAQRFIRLLSMPMRSSARATTVSSSASMVLGWE